MVSSKSTTGRLKATTTCGESVAPRWKIRCVRARGELSRQGDGLGRQRHRAQWIGTDRDALFPTVVELDIDRERFSAVVWIHLRDRLVGRQRRVRVIVDLAPAPTDQPVTVVHRLDEAGAPPQPVEVPVERMMALEDGLAVVGIDGVLHRPAEHPALPPAETRCQIHDAGTAVVVEQEMPVVQELRGMLSAKLPIGVVENRHRGRARASALLRSGRPSPTPRAGGSCGPAATRRLRSPRQCPALSRTTVTRRR